ncbi:MAG TPA: hypothetical protein VEG60_32010, partial [Candidatus Binatia bacterium]|nr:hypothetical protein [Candidatus Binatia bacterium]
TPPPRLSNASTEDVPHDNSAAAELRARNKDLLEEVSALSNKLEISESRLEQLETLRAHLNSKESEITELRWEYERLQSEVTTLRTPSASNEPPVNEAMQNPQSDAEIAALKEQLQASQAKVCELESAQMQPTVAPESDQKAFEELQRSLEVSTLQLQNALAAEQEKQKALEATQLQLSEMQQRYHELSEANLQLREANSQHQRKMTNQSQLQVERLVILRQRLDELRLQQAEVSERDRLIQDEIVSISQLLDVVPESAPMDETHYDGSLEFKETADADTGHAKIVERTPFGEATSEPYMHQNDSSGKTNGNTAETQHNHATDLTVAVAAATQSASELSPSETEKKRRFGIFPIAMGVLVVGGVLATGFLGKDSEQNPAAPKAEYEANLTPSEFSTATHMKSPPDPAERRHEDGRSVEEAVRAAPAIPQRPPVDSRITKPAEKATATSIAAYRKPSSTVSGSYEIIQPTRVFSAPRADAQLIANIEPGTQVNVVGSLDGWLEIRSKHGRPPGFIPKNAAIRIGPN